MRARLLIRFSLLAFVIVGLARCGGDETPTEPTPVCSFTIAPASGAFGSPGGSGTVTVTTSAGCAWSAASSSDWIAVTGGAAGNGAGTVAYSVSVNTDTQPRTGSITIAKQSHAVSQEGRPPTVCTYELSPDSSTFGNEGGTRTFTVSAPADCSWSALSHAAWVVINSGAQGSGNGTVSYSVAVNTGISERVADITVATRTFTVRQVGDVAACQYSVGPVDFTPCMPGGNVTATLTTDASCPWTANPDASWLGVPGGTSGAGSAVITISYGDNYDAPRQGIVMVRWPTATAGQNLRVAQAGCLYSVTRSSFTFTAAGGTGTFDVFQMAQPNTCGGATQDRCVWTAASDVTWLTITSSMPRTGDNPVAFTVAPITDGIASRTGHITVRDKVVTVTQSR